MEWKLCVRLVVCRVKREDCRVKDSRVKDCRVKRGDCELCSVRFVDSRFFGRGAMCTVELFD